MGLKEEVTVMVVVAAVVPQLLVTEYDITATPAVTPVTVPPTTVAFPLDDVQTPPDVVFVKVIFPPATTVVGPLMLPTVGSGLTVIEIELLAVPQLLLTV
jgi:hypothetical protein